MSAEQGNKHWQMRHKHGRNRIFKTPKSFYKAAIQYIDWCEDNPLIETKAFQFEGKGVLVKLPKMRAMTIRGLCRYLHISHDTWYEQKKREGFSDIMEELEGIIFDYKFQGAAAGLLNSNLIARELQIKDTVEVTDRPKVIIKDLSGAKPTEK